MRRIAVCLQLLFYSFIFIPVSHSIAPLPVIEFDNIVEGAPSFYSFSAVLGLVGLLMVLVLLNQEKVFIINILASIFLIVPVFQYINWHNFWIPALTSIPFILMSISSILQLR